MTLAVLLGMLAFVPAAPEAQPGGEAEASFEERFVEEPVAPTFTRPEVIDLLSSLRLWAAPGEVVATAEATVDETDRPEPLEHIILAEPKGPAKVLKDLLTTPITELLVSKAEAGPDVPPPEAQQPTPEPPQAADAPAQIASIPERSADPLSERPPAAESLASMPAPTGAAQAVQPAEVATANAEPGSEQTGERAEEGRHIASGRAAWYQHPGRTASGERFNPNELTAAHRTLPFGTRVRVVHKPTGRSVVVRINDRIPRKAKIVIDLSRASARLIGLAGVGQVSLYQLNGPVARTSPGHMGPLAAR